MGWVVLVGGVVDVVYHHVHPALQTHTPEAGDSLSEPES